MTRNAIFQPRKLNFEGKNIVIWNKNNIFAVGNICNHSDQNKINIYMQDAVVNKIKSKIAHGKFGEVYFVSSFPQYDVEYVTKLLAIFEKEGIISRIAKGGYVKARKTWIEKSKYESGFDSQWSLFRRAMKAAS